MKESYKQRMQRCKEESKSVKSVVNIEQNKEQIKEIRVRLTLVENDGR